MEQENKFSVAIHYEDTLGYIEYDGDAKKAAAFREHSANGMIVVADSIQVNFGPGPFGEIVQNVHSNALAEKIALLYAERAGLSTKQAACERLSF